MFENDTTICFKNHAHTASPCSGASKTHTQRTKLSEAERVCLYCMLVGVHKHRAIPLYHK